TEDEVGAGDLEGPADGIDHIGPTTLAEVRNDTEQLLRDHGATLASHQSRGRRFWGSRIDNGATVAAAVPSPTATSTFSLSMATAASSTARPIGPTRRLEAGHVTT